MSSYKNIGIIIRKDTPKALAEAKKLSLWLNEQSLVVYCEPSVDLCEKTKKLQQESDFDKIDLLVVLGGDGTYLQALSLIHI